MPKKILLADDSITIQKVVELTFSDGDYEVIATNNGARAIQKLSEVRPDIVLTDIIMPEKNGYEVCEYVKSHPEFRSIPVILLTGTFEPFDPERAEKAGCDAVVTKPFESQSLVHKVEELIEQSSRNAPSPSAEADSVAPALEALEGETRAWPLPSFQFGSSPSGSEPAEFNAPGDADSPFAPIPGAAGGSPGAAAFDSAPFENSSSSTAPEASASDDFMGAADAADDSPFAATSDALFAPPSSEPAFSSDEPGGSPFAAGGESSFAAGDETQPQSPAPFGTDRSDLFAQPDSGPANLPFEEPSSASSFAGEASPFGGVGSTSDAVPSAAGPEDAQPEDAWSGETRAMPKMSFDDLRGYQEQGSSSFAPWQEQEEPREEPRTADDGEAERGNRNATAWDDSFSSELSTGTTPIATSGADPWGAPDPMPTVPEAASPATEEAIAPEAAPMTPDVAQEWSPSPAVSEPGMTFTAETPAAVTTPAGELTDEQIERIARRVVELISETTVRNIAWEVIPELAEMIVRQRIRELEAEEA